MGSVTRCYASSNGLTMNSARGTGVKLMCEHVQTAAAKINIKAIKNPSFKPRGRSTADGLPGGSVAQGYISWLKAQPKNTRPINSMRFSQLVAMFMPLYLQGADGAFSLMDETDMNYRMASEFGAEAAALLAITKKHGIKVQFSLQ